MNRKEMIRFINENVLPGAEISNDDWFYNGRAIFGDIIKGIEKWRIGKPANIEMNAQILNGVLYINGEMVKRVADKAQANTAWYSPAAGYWENRILARQGM